MIRRQPSHGRFEAAFLGGGPGGSGALVHAACVGRLDEVLARGVAVVDPSHLLVRGRVADYRIRSNSYGTSFLECLDGPHAGRVFARAAASDARRELEPFRASVAPLERVGAFLTEVGLDLRDRIEASRHSRFLRGSRAVAAHGLAGGGWEVALELEDGGAGTLEAERLVLALGGEQLANRGWRAAAERRAAATGRRVPPVLESDVVLAVEGPDRIERALDGVDAPTVTVVGGSHSAYSSAWVVLGTRAGARLAPGALRLQRRRAPRLYYDTRDAARADGYADWSEDDVCPLTRRVFRMGGLRGDAKDLHRAWMRGDEPRLALEDAPDPTGSEALDRALASDLVVAALGYRARTIPLFEADGTVIPLVDQLETRLVDRACRIRRADGAILEGVLAIGLGSGFRPDGDLGGEPSFDGQTNGLWLYQNGIGKLVLDQALPPVEPASGAARDSGA